MVIKVCSYILGYPQGSTLAGALMGCMRMYDNPDVDKYF